MRVFAVSLALLGCGSAASPEGFSSGIDAAATPGSGGAIAAGGSAPSAGGTVAQGSGGNVSTDSGATDATAADSPFDGGRQDGELCENDVDCPDGFSCVQVSAACDEPRACLGKQQTRCIRQCTNDADCPSDGCCGFYEPGVGGYYHVQSTNSCPNANIRACGDPTFCKFVPGLPPC